MKLSTSLLFIIALTGSIVVSAAPQLVTGKDGRDILLNEDGSWEYASESTLVETADGRKARIKEDNTWEYLEESKPRTTQSNDGVVIIDVNKASSTSATQATGSQNLSVGIDEIFIIEEESKAGISKATRRTAEMHINIKLSSVTKTSLAELSKSSFIVRDSRGNAYPVESISLSDTEISNGSSAFVTLITDSVPGRLFAPKELYIEIDQNSIGQNESVKLSYPFGMVDRRDG